MWYFIGLLFAFLGLKFILFDTDGISFIDLFKDLFCSNSNNNNIEYEQESEDIMEEVLDISQEEKQKNIEALEKGNEFLNILQSLSNELHSMSKKEDCESVEFIQSQIGQLDDYIEKVKISLQNEDIDELKILLSDFKFNELQYLSHKIQYSIMLLGVKKSLNQSHEKINQLNISNDMKQEEIQNFIQQHKDSMNDLKSNLKLLSDLKETARQSVKCEIEYVRDYYHGTRYESFSPCDTYKIGIKFHNTSLEKILGYVLFLNLYSGDTVVQTLDCSKRVILEPNELHKSENICFCSNEFTKATIKQFKPIFQKSTF